MVIMDSLIGDTNITVNDTLSPSEKVIYTSNKHTAGGCIGKCFLTGMDNNLTLIPITQEGYVKSNTFTCPWSGWWMIWVNWGHPGPFSTAANGSLSYKVNDSGQILMTDLYNCATLASVPHYLRLNDRVQFPARTSLNTAFEGTYCFEFLRNI